MSHEQDPNPESWACIDCGINTAPGFPTRNQMKQEFNPLRRESTAIKAYYNAQTEVYIVKDKVWKAAGMDDFGGCLCIGCLELRLGRKLSAKDFPRHPFNDVKHATERLLDRRRR